MKDQTCMYCTENEKLDSIMIYIADLGVSKLYLFKEQTYYGRCIVAHNNHVRELFDLDDAQAALFVKDINVAARAVQNAVSPDKINYGIYSDKLPHLHCHVVPKKDGGHSFGSTFAMNVEPPVYLSEDGYKEIIEKIKGNLA